LVIISQNQEWFRCPPPAFRVTVCTFSGSFLTSRSSSAMSLPSRSGASAAYALFRASTNAWWCLVWCRFIVSASMTGSRAS
jgi:hypothetical protein